MAKETSGGGIGDILSMALLQTGVDSLASPPLSMDSSSILNAAADTLDSTLLSSDIGSLTEGLFSTLNVEKSILPSPSSKSTTALNYSLLTSPTTRSVSEDQRTLATSLPAPTTAVTVSADQGSLSSALLTTTTPAEVVPQTQGTQHTLLTQTTTNLTPIVCSDMMAEMLAQTTTTIAPTSSTKQVSETLSHGSVNPPQNAPNFPPLPNSSTNTTCTTAHTTNPSSALDDIDLSELLPVPAGDEEEEGMMSTHTDHLALMDMELNMGPPTADATSGTHNIFSSLQGTSQRHSLSVGGSLLNMNSDITENSNSTAPSCLGDLTELLNIPETQYLGSLNADFVGPSRALETNTYRDNTVNGNGGSLTNTSSGVSDSLSAITNLVQAASTNAGTTSLALISSSSSSSSFPPPIITTPTNTTPSSSSSFPPPLLPISTSTTTSSSLSSKLDITAILNKVAQNTTSVIVPTTTARTSSVSVTVIPTSTVLNGMGQSKPKPTIVPLHSGLGGLAKGPMTLKTESGSNVSLKLLNNHPNPQQKVQPSQEEESDDEDEHWSAANTYANYKPAKLKIGYSHPDPIVESSSLTNVEPPQVWFDLKLPSHVIEEVQLSSLQLEAVVYACQQHMNILSDGTRAGYLIGDGAGVGKGRTIAGIIYQNYLEGRKKAVWLSVSNDLKYDALRDLRDVGAKKISVSSLNKFHYGKISGKRNGRVRKGVIFSTYSSLIGESSSGGKYRTRFNQLLHWLGPQFEGVIVFDECHKAKNLVPTGYSKPSKTGLTVLQLQKKLPKARIVYCSATGASEPRNMAYMSRLGIWGAGTQFPMFQDFMKAVERRGVGAMEIVAMDMKLRGMYTARQLSFTGVTFDIRDVSLTDTSIEMYDSSVDLWVEAKKLFQEAADLMDYDRKKVKTMWGQFWAAHQRFFKYLCIAAKVPEAIMLAKRALQEGKCVVIGLQSTGEARTLEQLEQSRGELSGFISTAKGVLETLIKRHFPMPISPGFDWDIFENDPTLPNSCRKRKRNGGRGGGGGGGRVMFQEEDFSSDSDNSSSDESDSAVESSSDEGEGGEEEEEEEGEGEELSGGSDSSSSDEGADSFDPFGFCEKPWASKPKTKKRKKDTSQIKGNFSIKPPPASSGGKGRGRIKTGFNSKSLKFEPVGSPKEASRVPIERRQSVAVMDGLSHSLSSSSSSSLFRQQSFQQAVSGQRDLLNIMSNSAMTTGSNSSLRNITVKKMKEELLKKLEVLSQQLPTNTLDELIDGLGGPHKVAEMTGRRGRVVSLPGGTIQYQLRSESDVSLEMLNLTEKQRFMDGEKTIAIISEAASSGVSLQSDRRAKNHKRRVHITLELPWSADKAIQQFGRTHRSNQVNSPQYIFLISELAGEKRFASVVAKRLESLGALTHGDRRATESRDLSKFHVDTRYGRMALEAVMKSFLEEGTAIVKSEEYPPDFFCKCRSAMIGVDLLTRGERGLYGLEKEATNMSRFLNRILGLPVHLQNQLFAYFMDTLSAIIKQAKRTGSWDGGILDFGASGEEVEVVEVKEYFGDPAYGTATTQLHKVQVERGMPFSDALHLLNTDYLPGEGFYMSKKPRNNKHVAVLLKVADVTTNHFAVYRPNTGRQSRSEKLKLLLKKYTKVDPVEAEKWWIPQYASSLSVCSHAFWQGRCKLSLIGRPCKVGLRRRHYHILSGSVLGVWTHVEGVFARHSGHYNRMQIARVQTTKNKLVGILIPTACVEDMKLTLTRVAEQASGLGEEGGGATSHT